MFCRKCGAQVEDGAKFCPKCGNTMESTGTGAAKGQAGQKPAGQKRAPGQPPEKGLLAYAKDGVCPACGSRSCEVQVLQDVSGSGSNYNCCYGLCGRMVLGPFGLLCGLGGTGSKTTTTQKSVWVCRDCGNRLPVRQELLAQWIGSEVSSALLSALLLGIGAFALKIGFTWGIILLTAALFVTFRSTKFAAKYLGKGVSGKAAVASGILTTQELRAWMISVIASVLLGTAFFLFCLIGI